MQDDLISLKWFDICEEQHSKIFTTSDVDRNRALAMQKGFGCCEMRKE